MEELEKLASDLGVDISDDIINVTKNSTNLISVCKEIYISGCHNDLGWRWNIGDKVKDAYDNPDKYNSGILKTLSDELDISISDLSRFKKFRGIFDIEYVNLKVEKGFSWSHFKILSDLNDDVRLLVIDMINKMNHAPKISEFLDLIDSINKQETITADGSDAEASTSDTVSPLKSINKSLKLTESLGDCLSDVCIQMHEGVEFSSDDQKSKYDEKLSELKVELSRIVEIINQIVKE